MKSVSKTLALYMKPIGVRAFAEALYLTANSLDRFCRQIQHSALGTMLQKSGLVSPGPFNGWTLPDALWLADCVRLPQLNFYPLGEISERAYKRTILWLAFFNGQRPSADLNADLRIIQKNIREVIRSHKTSGVMSFFLTEYLYEIHRDAERRVRKDMKEDDPPYRFHYLEDGRLKSLTLQRTEQSELLDRCRRAANRLRDALVESVEGNTAEPVTAALIGLYREKLHKLPKSSKQVKARKPPLNVVVGDKPLSELKRSFSVDPNLVRLSLHEKRSNVAFDRSVVEKQIAALLDDKTFRLHSLSRDLLDIGAVVYMADQMVKRERTLKRRLDILMPVRHYTLWNQVKKSLAEAVSFLGRDEVNFHFIKRRDRKDDRLQAVKFRTKSSGRCVSLFSGGLDSTAGALQILEAGLDPLFVSHHSNPQTSGIQKHLLYGMEQAQEKHLPWLSVFVGRTKKKRVSHELGGARKSPMTQFLRSFLFLSLASVAAVELGCDRLFIFENGPVALNPMFSEARVNTRTAHPRFLAGFQALIHALYKVNVRIENPFLYETKGEVALRLAKPKYRKLVKETNSCWNAHAVPLWAQQRGLKDHSSYHHDGSCLPCVIRRASLVRAGLEAYDGKYLRDVFAEFLRFEIKDRLLAADYLRFCGNIETLSGADLLMEYPDLSVCAAGVEVPKLVDMVLRQAREIVGAFCKHGSKTTIEQLIPL